MNENKKKLSVLENVVNTDITGTWIDDMAEDRNPVNKKRPPELMTEEEINQRISELERELDYYLEYLSNIYGRNN